MREGVSVWPGPIFFPNGDGGEHGIRLSYADTSAERITEGLRRLRQAVATVN